MSIDWDRWRPFPHKRVLFSGGKDSTCALHLVRSHYDDVKAVHIDTTCALPDLLPHVRRVCKQVGVPLDVVRPEADFFALCEKRGAPTIRRRWCMEELKLKPLKRYFDRLDPLRSQKDIVVFDGRRASDSWMRKRFFERIGTYWNLHRILQVYCVSPLWDWSDEQIAAYLREHDLPGNPLYPKLGMGGDCLCPVYKCKDFWLRLRRHYPEQFQRLLEIEASWESGGSFAVRGPRKIYLREVAKQRMLDEFL